MTIPKKVIKIRENEFLKPSSKIIGSFLDTLNELIYKVADLEETILITGPTGVGKSLAARYIHDKSNRARKCFGLISCNISDTLIESELFGHIKGSFTGAYTNRKGMVKTCEGGTLFLDEIGDISNKQQANLLRLLEEKVYKPVGSDEEQKANIRIIAATNKNLEDLMINNLFREDLFHRLNVVSIKIPSLIERKKDIALLIDYFIKEFEFETQERVPEETKNQIKIIYQYHPLPGNVRQLKNEIRSWLLIGKPKTEPYRSDCDNLSLSDLPLDYKETSKIILKSLIIRALTESNGKRTIAAKILNISTPTLIRKIKEFNISL